jgi:formate-dependent nitrite reductase membrane component NrfD
MHVEQMIVGVEAIVLFLFLRRTRRVSEQGKDSVRLLLFGEMKWIFWGGIVLSGFIFPILLETIASFFPGKGLLIFIAGILLLSGGFFLRLGVLHAGIKEQIPMHRLMEIQYNAMMERTKALERLREKRTQAPGLG